MSLSFQALSSLRHVPGFPQFSVSALLLGTAASFAVPYMPLFARNEAGMSPLLLGIFMTMMSLSGVLISTVLARWSDRGARNKPVMIAAILSAAIGYVLLCTTRSYVPLVLIASLFLGTGAAAFPQLFAFAKTHFALAGDDLADRSMITLRSMFSIAWMLGPAAAAVILGTAGFTGLFLATAVCYLLVGVPLALSRSRPVSRTPAAPVPDAPVQPAGPQRSLTLVALSFVLFGMSNTMGFIALPLHVTGAMGEPSSTVGWLIGLCAFLEVPFILSFALFSGRFSNERLITLSLGLFVAYFVMMAVAPAVWLLAVAQLIRAAVIAVMTTLGMAYFQELMPHRTSTALTLYANTNSIGAVLAGVVSGAFAQAFGYQAVFVLCAALTGAAFVLLYAVTRKTNAPALTTTQAGASD
ncbi:sugar efflux transporter [Deinococcus deserti]|uniref:Putative sugar efflux transporter putative membrane protein n=1 Tax=Deinococcus deserti (strain DSM 17065 / CIP 109153 / LMG 22923 / VCD115) TaxID=546414 RepID=C1D2T3_DEIDV|nr:sugar efflux transporter [Deinococcus deserti]ACO47722.1 putative sugar efflux transporter; putative membrane protein [Deinococcus deserti VCD115]